MTVLEYKKIKYTKVLISVMRHSCVCYTFDVSISVYARLVFAGYRYM